MSDVSDESLRLDGNAAAGLLAEIFPFEMTSAHTSCAGCGQTRPIGALLLYGGEMGAILRCPHCNCAQLRIVRARGRYVIDMRGVTLMQIETTTQA
jgi:hypothetical protein